MFSSVQYLSLVQLCNPMEPMDCSMSGFPVHHQLPEPTQTHVHRISDVVLVSVIYHCESLILKSHGLPFRRPRFDSWVGKIPWRRERLPTPVFWPGEILRLYSPWGCKEWDTTERLSLFSYIYIYIYVFFRFFSLICYYKIFSIVPCAMQ